MKKIHVRLKSRSYPIVIGSLSSAFLSELKRVVSWPPSKIFVVSSPRIQKAGALKRVTSILKRSGVSLHTALIPDGETKKNLGTVQELFKEAFIAKLDRRSLVVVIGGGVLTDMAGLFAATYMRGIAYASVPTTMLGMVDAAIGGKTAVDLPEGKNLLGAFWQPKLVWNDASLLKTLPAREWRTGLAEVVKYGVIWDAPFFAWLEKKVRRSANPQHWSASDLDRILSISAAAKAAIVSADENEKPLAGGREILNFGHTIGHALEAATGYRSLTHGEAISIGMVAAGRLALRKKLWSEDAQLRLSTLLEALGLPIAFPRLTARQRSLFWSALQHDKKHVGGLLRFVLPVRLGRVVVQSGLPVSLVRSVLA